MREVRDLYQDDFVYLKDGFRRPPMALVMANILTDPGQQALWAALSLAGAVRFRLLLSDSRSIREWSAMVVKLGEVFDEANNIIRLQAELQPTASFIKGVI